MYLLLPPGALFALFLLASPAGAAIYSWTDAQGNRVYSDQPHSGAQTIELEPTNGIAPTAPPSTSANPPATDQQQATGNYYRELRITSPADDSNLRSNEGSLSISVQTDPPLSPSHVLKISIDGVLSAGGVPGNGAPSQQLTAQNIDRGTHSIAVVVVNARGEQLQSSTPVTIHLQRTSLNQPARQGKNQAPKAPSAPRAPNMPKPPNPSKP